MIHHASPDFWACYRLLPEEVQKLADQAYKRLKEDLRYPSLHFKKVGRFWSARMGGNYCALAVEAADGLVWFWIGTHADYDKFSTPHGAPRRSSECPCRTAACGFALNVE